MWHRLTRSDCERTPHAMQRCFQRVASAPFSAALATAAATAASASNLERAVETMCLISKGTNASTDTSNRRFASTASAVHRSASAVSLMRAASALAARAAAAAALSSLRAALALAEAWPCSRSPRRAHA